MNSVAAKSLPLGVAILAAGASSRMGQPKMLLPWGDSSVLGHLIAQWQNVGAAQIAVVCAAEAPAIHTELDRIGFSRDDRILNPEPARGMFSSVQCAARWENWSPALTHWVIALGDQPQLMSATLRAVAEFSAQNPGSIVQPTRNGRPRHPVFLPAALFKGLTTSQHRTLKMFLQANSSAVRLIELADPGLDFDLDTPADYEEARRRFHAQAPIAESCFPPNALSGK